MRLVQLAHASEGRRVAAVEEPHLTLLREASVFDLAQSALRSGRRLADAAAASRTATQLLYDDVYSGESDWCLLPPADHPGEPARCLVAGTGLTHLGSAANRQAMHAASEADLTDSMKIYRWGVEAGRPAPGAIGVEPEWFYKGHGSSLRAHGEPLDVPAFAGDGGEEAEIAGVYVIDLEGRPRRIGMAQGNEFSDHVTEKKNYLYLAPSKLRTHSLGPELVIDPDFSGRVGGRVRVLRGGTAVWEKAIASGEAAMSHSLANLEHHHFKFPEHRRSGDVHIHFFGADAFSFGEGVKLQPGDEMEVSFDGFGRPLRNALRVCPGPPLFTEVTPV